MAAHFAMKRILVLILAAALLLGAIWYTRREELLPVTLHTTIVSKKMPMSFSCCCTS